MSAVRRDQRHTQSHPCRICGGYDGQPGGHGQRCWGFLSSDGEYEHCTRDEPEYAGNLRAGTDGAYAHRLHGPCACGKEHGASDTEAPRARPIKTRYEVRSKNGQLRATHVRIDFLDASGKPYRKKSMPWDPPGIETATLPLFGIDELPEPAVCPHVVLAEGEKAGKACKDHGLPAVATVTGADGTPEREVLADLVGYEVWLWPDNDAKGRQHMTRVAAVLTEFGVPVRWVVWTDAPDKGDAYDYFAAGGTVKQLLTLTEPATTREPERDGAIDPEPKNDVRRERGPSVAEQLIKIGERADLFHDPEGTTWATVEVDGHRETWRTQSKQFKHWLARALYLAVGKSATSEAMSQALLTLGSKALFDGPGLSVYVRLAEHEGGIYLDLADERWRAVMITARGWEVMNDPPVKFRRAKGMLPLPMPVRGGSLDALRPFVNVRKQNRGSDPEWKLFVGWLVATLRPSGPFPVLALNGEQGSAKTTLARIARALVDPNAAPVRSAPKDERDLAIAANNSWCLVLDNLSAIQQWLSDALCRLSTGGGHATRALYENDEETIFDAMRPIILTSIEDVASRGDLVDRAVMLSLEPISETQRKLEAELWADFDAARPHIIGALLDAVSGALSELPRTQPGKLPRMADFAKWGIAAGKALGWGAEEFLVAYQANRADANTLALEASPVAEALRAFIEGGVEPYDGTPTGLLAALTAQAGETVTKAPTWPKSPRALTSHMKRLAPNLRRAGITVTPYRAGDVKHSRMWRIEKVGDASSEPSAGSEADAAPGNTSPQTSDGSRAVHVCGGQPSEIASEAPAQANPRAVPFSNGSDYSDVSNRALPRCIRCGAIKLPLPDGGYQLTCACGTVARERVAQ